MARRLVLASGSDPSGGRWTRRERSHLPGLGPDDDPTGVRLQDCVDALVHHLEGQGLQDVVLVAHSWGGIPAGGAAARLAGRLKHLIMVSAFVPEVG